MTFDEFKQCVQIQSGLDMEALDVAFVEPLKDLKAWWDRQGDATHRYVNYLFGTGLLAGAVQKFLGRVIGGTAVLATEALGAVAVGIALGVFLDILGRCGLQELEVG